MRRTISIVRYSGWSLKDLLKQFTLKEVVAFVRVVAKDMADDVYREPNQQDLALPIEGDYLEPVAHE